jgi:hypothetical protein
LTKIKERKLAAESRGNALLQRLAQAGRTLPKVLLRGPSRKVQNVENHKFSYGASRCWHQALV